MRITLKATLAALFGGVALIVTGQGILSISKLATIRQGVHEVATNWLPSVATVNEINAAASQLRLRQYRLVTTSTNPEKLAENRRLYDAATASMIEVRKRYEPMSPRRRSGPCTAASANSGVTTINRASVFSV